MRAGTLSLIALTSVTCVTLWSQGFGRMLFVGQEGANPNEGGASSKKEDVEKEAAQFDIEEGARLAGEKSSTRGDADLVATALRFRSIGDRGQPGAKIKAQDNGRNVTCRPPASSPKPRIIWCRYPRGPFTGTGTPPAKSKFEKMLSRFARGKLTREEDLPVMDEQNPCMFPEHGCRESVGQHEVAKANLFGASIIDAIMSRRLPSKCLFYIGGQSSTGQCVDEEQQAAATTREHKDFRLGTRPVAEGAYRLLALSLQRALESAEFRGAVASSGLWVELGVFRGTSINLTAAFLGAATQGLPHARRQAVTVDGFDTFEGLPTNWSDPKSGHVTYPQGAFSWRALAGPGGPPVPPVSARARLHVGLAGDTLPPYLAARPGRPLAWLNADFDLLEGTLGALVLLAPRLVRGTRLHFHELNSEVHRHWPPRTTFEPANEALALREFLLRFPCVVLRMEDVAPHNGLEQSASFVVVKGPLECD